MLSDEGQGTASAGEDADGGGSERRRAYRRRVPCGRGALLEVAGRNHIVGLADVSVTGAYITTRAPLAVGEVHALTILVLPDRFELSLRSLVVRIALGEEESPSHPRGVALHFVDPDAATRALLQRFVGRPEAAR